MIHVPNEHMARNVFEKLVWADDAEAAMLLQAAWVCAVSHDIHMAPLPAAEHALDDVIFASWHPPYDWNG